MRDVARAPPAAAGRGGSANWARAFRRPFPRAWYDRPTVDVARELLGSLLVHRTREEYRAARIVETEAYLTGDPASHAFRGMTPRNRSMFSRPGTLYVFRIHQVHCANAVTRRGEAVLLRAAEPLGAPFPSLSGPGRLARGMAITRREDGWDLTRSAVRLLPGGPPPPEVGVAARVGISRARELPLRFYLPGHRAVSRPRPGGAPV